MAERGPFNAVFHGIQPDWIEEEMDDDIDFKKDVLEQRIRTIIRDQVQKLVKLINFTDFFKKIFSKISKKKFVKLIYLI